jgi:hypothetical protein
MLVPTLLWLIVPIPVFIGSIILFRRVHDVPALLILIGSIGYLLWHGIDLAMQLIMPYALEHHDSRFINAIWPTDTPHPAFDIAGHVLRGVSLCFPIGFVWFALRATRRT